MKEPLFIRALTTRERETLVDGLGSTSAFTRRRCEILLANAEGKTASKIAVSLGCAQQTVLNALNAYLAEGLACLVEKSHCPKNRRRLIEGCSAEKVCAILRRTPQEFGKPLSQWTYASVAEVAFEQGLIGRAVSEETIRQLVKRLGVDWKKARASAGVRQGDSASAPGGDLAVCAA